MSSSRQAQILLLHVLLALAASSRPPIPEASAMLEVGAGSEKSGQLPSTDDMDLRKEKDLKIAAAKVRERWVPTLGLSDPRFMAKIGFGVVLVVLVIALGEFALNRAKNSCLRGCPLAPAVCCVASFAAGTVFYNHQRRIWQLATGLGGMVAPDLGDELVLGSVFLVGALATVLLVNVVGFFVGFTAQRDMRRILFAAKSDLGPSCCLRTTQCVVGNALTQILLGAVWMTFLASLAASYVATVAALMFSSLLQGCGNEEKTAQLQKVLGEVASLISAEEQLRGVDVAKLCPLLDAGFQPVNFVVAGALLVVTQTAMISIVSRDRARIKDEIERSKEGSGSASNVGSYYRRD